MAYPAPLPLEDLFGQRFLPCSFPQVSVAYSVWPSDAKDTAKTGVDKALDLLIASHVVFCFLHVGDVIPH